MRNASNSMQNFEGVIYLMGFGFLFGVSRKESIGINIL
jgi:hypothetical protein